MKIRLVKTELFYAGGQTDMTKLVVAFGNFANTRKNNKETEIKTKNGKAQRIKKVPERERRDKIK